MLDLDHHKSLHALGPKARNKIPISEFYPRRVPIMMNQIFWSFYTVTVLGSVAALILITFV
jgi:hypothetical protein